MKEMSLVKEERGRKMFQRKEGGRESEERKRERQRERKREREREREKEKSIFQLLHKIVLYLKKIIEFFTYLI